MLSAASATRTGHGVSTAPVVSRAGAVGRGVAAATWTGCRTGNLGGGGADAKVVHRPRCATRSFADGAAFATRGPPSSAGSLSADARLNVAEALGACPAMRAPGRATGSGTGATRVFTVSTLISATFGAACAG